MPPAVIAHVPVVHRGYVEFLKDVGRKSNIIWILGDEFVSEFTELRKDIRALSPTLVVEILHQLYPFCAVGVLDRESLAIIPRYVELVYAPDEDVSRGFLGRYLPGVPRILLPVFLRWDRSSALRENAIVADETVSADGCHRTLFGFAAEEAKKSSDWWRRVGAVLVASNGERIIGHNTHTPSPHSPYYHGDPRNEFSRGVRIDLSTADHAEAVVIATAARMGTPTQGSSLFVTTFPCPPCARLIARAGVAKLFFSSGYAMLDGERVLRDADVSIVRVEGVTVDEGGRTVPYP